MQLVVEEFAFHRLVSVAVPCFVGSVKFAILVVATNFQLSVCMPTFEYAVIFSVLVVGTFAHLSVWVPCFEYTVKFAILVVATNYQLSGYVIPFRHSLFPVLFVYMITSFKLLIFIKKLDLFQFILHVFVYFHHHKYSAVRVPFVP